MNPTPLTATPRWNLVCALASLVAVAACGGGGGGSAEAAPAPSPAPSPTSAPGPAAPPLPAPAPPPSSGTNPAPAAWGTPVNSARVFISGHSLTDNPLGDNLVSVANGLIGGQAAKYNQQISIGSPIRIRTDVNSAWAGYRTGKNREGSGMNVINELRNPATLGGDRYDTLVITERHDLLQSLQWENTVRYLRHYHERLIAGNAQGRTYFYESWWGIADKSNPAAWIAHERGASTAWQCIGARVNTSLAAEGRADRILPLPAGAALAELLERATQGNVAGITGANATETANRLFSDDVHLTALGSYYMSLVTYAAVYQRSPVGAWAPSGVSATQARSLQDVAWSYVSNFYSRYQSPDLATCRAAVATSFCPIYWNYRNQPGSAASCTATFSAQNAANNPLFYSAGTDASYWYPAP